MCCHAVDAMNKGRQGIIEQYRDFLPVALSTPSVAMGEGNTPLIRSPRLSEMLGRGCEVYVKYEGLNPTGSFKDRGMTVAVSNATAQGIKAVVCASTGNTSASAAAYAARAGIKCIVILPAGKIARGKLLQAFAYGAKVIAIEGNFDDAFRLVRTLGIRKEFTIVNSINPDRIAGQMTAAFEVVDELGEAPEYHLIPVGNAGNITAYWQGYREYRNAGKNKKAPRMFGFQAAGAAPIYRNEIVAQPETVATAIRIGNPASWGQARAAVRDSGGMIDIVTDEEILEAQSWLARSEGIFVEPASAASIAGLMKCAKRQTPHDPRAFADKSTIVCTVTGHGLKDPDVIPLGRDEMKPVPATEAAILAAISA